MEDRKYPKLRITSNIPFGKYKGFSVITILRVSKNYIKWLVENTDIKLSDELQKLYDNSFDESKGIRAETHETVINLSKLASYYEVSKELPKSEIRRLLKILKEDDKK
jgi:uncharacterized protein (DUF3820 family)